jgi:hypothetical protein
MRDTYSTRSKATAQRTLQDKGILLRSHEVCSSSSMTIQVRIQLPSHEVCSSGRMTAPSYSVILSPKDEESRLEIQTLCAAISQYPLTHTSPLRGEELNTLPLPRAGEG